MSAILLMLSLAVVSIRAQDYPYGGYIPLIGYRNTGEHPGQISSLVDGSLNSNTIACGAVIINETHFLSAASCFPDL